MPALDTSVIVAFYIPEAISGRVQRLFSSGTPLAINSLVEVEFASAVARRVRMRSISHDDGRLVLEEFALHVRENLYAFNPVTQEAFTLAGEWLGSLRTSLRTLDALQLAMAHVNDLSFMTADKALAKAARELGLAIEAL